MKRRVLTRPQYELLKRIDSAPAGETRLAYGRDRNMARRLEGIDCVKMGEGYWWRITDHGRNILDNHHSFFEEGRR